jgi:hypothetical protein
LQLRKVLREEYSCCGEDVFSGNVRLLIPP